MENSGDSGQHGESGTYGVPSSLFTLVPGRLVNQRSRISLNAICCTLVQAEGDRAALHTLIARGGPESFKVGRLRPNEGKAQAVHLSFLTEQGESCVWRKETGPELQWFWFVQGSPGDLFSAPRHQVAALTSLLLVCSLGS